MYSVGTRKVYNMFHHHFNYSYMEADYNSDPSTASKIDFNTPANKKEIPCDTCEYEDTCALKVLECSAFRNWASTGDYKETDVVRLLRAA